MGRDGFVGQELQHVVEEGGGALRVVRVLHVEPVVEDYPVVGGGFELGQQVLVEVLVVEGVVVDGVVQVAGILVGYLAEHGVQGALVQNGRLG